MLCYKSLTFMAMRWKMPTFALAYIILIRYRDDCKEQEEALALSFRTGTH